MYVCVCGKQKKKKNNKQKDLSETIMSVWRFITRMKIRRLSFGDNSEKEHFTYNAWAIVAPNQTVHVCRIRHYDAYTMNYARRV